MSLPAFDPAHVNRDRCDWHCETTRELLAAWHYMPTIELGHALADRLVDIERDLASHACFDAD